MRRLPVLVPHPFTTLQGFTVEETEEVLLIGFRRARCQDSGLCGFRRQVMHYCGSATAICARNFFTADSLSRNSRHAILLPKGNQSAWPQRFRHCDPPPRTSLSLFKGMPDKAWAVTPPLVSAICTLLKHLPKVARMRLRPGSLAAEVLHLLGDDSER